MHTRERLHSLGVALRGLTAGAAGIAVCLGAGVAHAQSGKGAYVGGWSVSGSLGYAIPNTDEYDDVFAWSLGVGYSRMPRLEIGLELGRFSTVVTQPETDGLPTHDLASGRLDILPVCLTLRYRAPLPASMATFIVLAGAGYYFVDYTMADAPRAVQIARGGEALPDQTVGNAWGGHAGAGLEYALTGWLSVTVEGRYLFLAPDFSGTAKDDHQIAGSLDLNTWLFTGGIRVAF